MMKVEGLQQFLASAVEQSFEGMAIADLKGHLMYVNPAWAEMHGYQSAEELIGKSLHIFHNQEQIDKDVEPFNMIVKEKGKHIGEVGHIRKDGTPFPTMMTTTLIKDVSGVPVAILGLARVISERKSAEEELREKDAMLVKFASQVPGMLYQFKMAPDGNFSVPYSSEGIKDIFGCSPKEVHDDFDPIFKAIHPEDRDKVLQTINESVKHMSQWKCEYRVKLPGEPIKWLLGNSIPEKSTDGSIVWSGYNVDITDRKDAEEKIINSQKRYQRITENAPDMIYRMSLPDGNYEYVSPAAEEITGYTPDEFYESPTLIKKIMHPDWVNYFNEEWEKLIAGDIPPTYEYSIIHKSGEVRWLSQRNVLIKDESEKPAAIEAIVMDMTALKEMEKEKERLNEQLRQSQKMEAVGTMAGGIAHDFNNILTIILGNLELVIDGLTPDNPLRDDLEEALKASDRAKDLVSQILAFSRKEKQELIPIHPQSMIKETLKLLRSTTPTTVSIVQDISEDCGLVKADPTGLHQILMNLFTNAVQSMDEKGEVTVSLQEVILSSDELDQLPARTKFFSIKTPGTYVRLSVTDKGCGMDEKTVERIFDPFYTTKEVGEGTGMGLSVVHGIVESHGGFIDVDSEPGRGSTFHVFFPVTDEEEPVEAETISPQTGTERILIIDDEEALLTLGKRILDKLGYEVTAENNSVKAHEIFKSAPHQFDLIITDQSMPNMSGSELAAEIVKIRPGMPVILCTGYSSKVSKENAEELGISNFINKPYSKKILAEAVRKVLDAKL